MSTPVTVVLIVVAVGIATAAVVVLRRGSGLAWPSLGLAAATATICFTVGGATGADLHGPDVATTMGAFVGVATVAAAIISLVPRDAEGPPSRVPVWIATCAAVAGNIGLVINLLTTS